MTKAGVVYVVATPMGHLGDITTRAVSILRAVDKIAVEDTRHSQKLLSYLGIDKPLVALHEHNEREQALLLLAQVEQGISLALISDAGTPLIRDPGYHLVRLAHSNNISVVPIPGPCAIIAALSAAGLPTNRFIFEGFLSAKAMTRRKQLETLVDETRTLVFFEAPHRILETVCDMAHVFGQAREAVIARELTKKFEALRKGPLSTLQNEIQMGIIPQRGEFVVLVEGRSFDAPTNLTPEAERILNLLLSELSVKKAVILAANITGLNKNALYTHALKNVSN